MELYQYLPTLSRFALALLLVLLMPKLMERIHLPGVVGFMAAGIVLGPHGLGIVDPHGAVLLFFADLGKLLLMFFAGFEIDMAEFSKARNRSAFFGLLTFSFPFVAGILVAHYSGHPLNSSLVIGSMLASHTLLALPIIKEAGLMHRESVMVTVGATVFTDILSILILAVCLPIHLSGFSTTGLLVQLLELAIFVPLILFGLSWVARFLLKNFGQSKSRRIAILLVLMAVAAQVAEFIHLEGIIGAFLAGIAAKRAFRETPTEDALEVVSQTLFIPAFFCTAGFLIDFKVFFGTLWHYPLLSFGLVGGLLLGKFIAAWSGGLLLRYKPADRMMMFSMSIPQVAATLAVALVAYGAVNASGKRLLDEPVLNATIVMVIVTSLLGLILAERYSKQLKSEPATN